MKSIAVSVFALLISLTASAQYEIVISRTLAWSPDGALLAVGARINDQAGIWLYDATGQVHSQISSPGNVLAIAWSPDGTRIAYLSGGSPDVVYIWSLATNDTSVAILQEGAASTNGLAWSPDGEYLLTERGISMYIWNANTGTLVMQLKQPRISGFQDYVWHPDGTQIWGADDYDSVRVWDVRTGSILREIEFSSLVTSIALSSDGAWGAFGTTEGKVIIRNLSLEENVYDWQVYSTGGLEAIIYNLVWNPDDERLLASGSYGPVATFDITTGTVSGQFVHSGNTQIEDIDISRYGGRIALALKADSRSNPNNFDMTDTTPIHQVLATGAVQILVPAPSLERLNQIAEACVRDGDTRAAELTDSAPAQISDLEAFMVQVDALPVDAIPVACRADLLAVADALLDSVGLSQEAPHVTALAWSPDGSRIVSATNSGHVQIWDADSGEVLAGLQGHDGVVYNISWKPDSSQFVTASPQDQVQRIWDADTGTQVVQFPGDSYYEGAAFVDWNPDSTTLISVASVIDGGAPLRFWQVEAGNVQQSTASYDVAAYDVAWNPEGTKLAVADFRGVLIFDDFSATMLEPRLVAPVHFTIAWSPDGTRLVAAESRTGAVNVIDVNTRQVILTVQGATDRIASVAWSPDGTTIFADNFNGTVQIWNALTGELLQTLPMDREGGRFLMSLSPYGGRLALGNAAIQAAPDADDGAFQILVPAPSLERLNRIAEACVRDGDARAAVLTDSAPAQISDLDAFVAQVDALPADAIPAACRADLLAVAEALLVVVP